MSTADPTLEIAVFIRALDGGGAQRDAILLANALAGRVAGIAVLTLQAEGRLRALVAQDVPVISIGATKLRSSLPALRRTLVRLRPRVLLSSEAAANVVAFLAARSLPDGQRPRIVLREVTSPTIAAKTDPYLQNRLAYKVLGPVFTRADRVVTLTHGARNDLVGDFHVPAERIAVMRSNAVLDPATHARLNAAAADPSPREPGLIVSVGRLSPEKDQITLVEAMARLGTHRPSRLVLVGDGPSRDLIAARVAALGLGDRVVLAGHCNDPFAWLLKAEVAVCSSRFEGFGNALIEAMACGTPVISTDCPWGPREILEDGRWGTLVPVGDAAALANALAQQLQFPADAQRLPDASSPPDRAALRQRAAAFTSQRAAEAFLEIVYGLPSHSVSAL